MSFANGVYVVAWLAAVACAAGATFASVNLPDLGQPTTLFVFPIIVLAVGVAEIWATLAGGGFSSGLGITLPLGLTVVGGAVWLGVTLLRPRDPDASDRVD